jgi:glycosyltransferase involved in cell wall biosynthesis
MFDHPRFGRRGRTLFWTAATLSHGLVSVCAEVDAFVRRRFLLAGVELFVVNNGIDMAPFLAVPARKLRDEVTFGLAGRMAPEKNHRVLIEAFGLLRRRHGCARLRFLGGGPLEPELKEQARSLGLSEAVEFCGFSHDVAGFLSQLDIFVLPSDFEALPLSLLEAIASGLPVVATAVDGVPKIVQTTDGGWLCPRGDAPALMGAMEAAITSPDRLERAERARRVVAELYSAERMARDYERVYQQLLQ